MLGRMQEQKKERTQRQNEFTVEMIQRDKQFTAAQNLQKRQERRQEVQDFVRLLGSFDSKSAALKYALEVESDNPELNALVVDIIPALTVSAGDQQEAIALEKRTRDAKLIREIHSEYGHLSEEGRRQLRKIAPDLAPLALETTDTDTVMSLIKTPAEVKRLTGREIREQLPPKIDETEASYRRRLESDAMTQFAKSLGLNLAEVAPAVEGIQPVKIANDEEFLALPSGTVYIGPDGITRTKP